MAKRITILGSTGSIGTSALKVIEALGADYEVYALTANNSIEQLAAQTQLYKPKAVAIADKNKYDDLRKLLSGIDVEIFAGPEGLVELAKTESVDIVLTAIVGVAGLEPVLAAAKAGKRLAIANKEPLVAAGELLMKTAYNSGSEILPVDSEHSAVFQAVQSGGIDQDRRIILTASGGPFRTYTPEQIENVSLEQALEHPTWDMGPKITIDSATMMNKALEIIEARWLFDIDAERIDVLIHPESIIHSMVEFVDSSVIAQLGLPDMCLPIQYALTYPDRVEGIAERVDFEKLSRIHFEKADFKKFRSLALGYKAAKAGGTATVVFNAAKQAAPLR
jgi:1-deoxy-D-xylulose-5-phosphate reductoisomerase